MAEKGWSRTIRATYATQLGFEDRYGHRAVSFPVGRIYRVLRLTGRWGQGPKLAGSRVFSFTTGNSIRSARGFNFNLTSLAPMEDKSEILVLENHSVEKYSYHHPNKKTDEIKCEPWREQALKHPIRQPALPQAILVEETQLLLEKSHFSQV